MLSRPFAPTSALLILLAGLAAGTSPAFAQEDGGGRSVFAEGAGNRALGLGGAFAGLADDASAPMWNPGGLGFLQRREFQASHTNLFGLGFSEQYASLALPSWRWGVTSVTFRHFGVGGIEQRDDRNVLLDGDLSDRQTELSFGFARPFRNAWSAGATLKLQRHSLAGFSGTGAGVDLGLMVRPLLAAGSSRPWAPNLSFGVAVRNVLEPTIRLDEESVPDPVGLRTGIGYRHGFTNGMGVILALDLEKTRSFDPRIHSGLEVHVLPMLALRAGAGAESWSAGTGIQWRDVQVDYLFENHAIDPVHRVGVSWSFGPTVLQSRQAALEAEEARLQERLAQAFERQQRSRMSGLRDRAQAAMNAQQYDEALDLLSTMEVLEPGDDGVRQLQATCLKLRGSNLRAAGQLTDAALSLSRALTLDPEDPDTATSLEEVRAELDRRARRSAAIRSQLNDALDHFVAERFVAAREGFQAILALNPQDADATEMFRRTEAAIQGRVASLVRQVRLLLDAAQFDAASTTLQDVRELDPDSSEVTRLAQELEQLRREASQQARLPAAAATPPAAQVGAEPVPTPIMLSPAQLREIEQLYQKGRAALEEGRTEDGIRYLELVWSSAPTHQKVSEYLNREYLLRGMEAFSSGDLSQAIRNWEDAVRVAPDDERALGYLARAQDKRARYREITGEAR